MHWLRKNITNVPKTLMIPYAIRGAIWGGVIFFVSALFIYYKFIPFPEIIHQASFASNGMLFVMSLFLGMIFGAASGVLVGIGTPPGRS